MNSASAIDSTFTYSAVTQWGNVLIVPTTGGWHEVRFQERDQSEDELLGTFPTVADAVEAACFGALETPSIDVDLSTMGLPKSVDDWDRHLRARA
jgi:hypothetical protein